MRNFRRCLQRARTSAPAIANNSPHLRARQRSLILHQRTSKKAMTYRRIEQSSLLDETGATSAQQLAQLLQRTAGGPAGYRLRRILLTNFWLYEYQTFEIPHCRLFLAGDN